jgi:enamine deaminase RidA (YjgF/YER057c/UK114 family)
MSTIQRIKPGPRMSGAVVHGDTIYLAGHVAGDPTADVAGQTRQILANIESTLASAGSDKLHILSATIWLSDIATFDEMNAVWDAWVAKDAPPARATVESKLAKPEYKVEIAVIAAKASSDRR